MIQEEGTQSRRGFKTRRTISNGAHMVLHSEHKMEMPLRLWGKLYLIIYFVLDCRVPCSHPCPHFECAYGYKGRKNKTNHFHSQINYQQCTCFINGNRLFLMGWCQRLCWQELKGWQDSSALIYGHWHDCADSVGELIWCVFGYLAGWIGYHKYWWCLLGSNCGYDFIVDVCFVPIPTPPRGDMYEGV